MLQRAKLRTWNKGLRISLCLWHFITRIQMVYRIPKFTVILIFSLKIWLKNVCESLCSSNNTNNIIIYSENILVNLFWKSHASQTHHINKYLFLFCPSWNSHIYKQIWKYINFFPYFIRFTQILSLLIIFLICHGVMSIFVQKKISLFCRMTYCCFHGT